jgi:hypothetical protein
VSPLTNHGNALRNLCFEYTPKNVTSNPIVWYHVHNVHICFKNKSENYLKHSFNNHSEMKNLCSYLFRMHVNHSFSKTNYHIGSSIKWWKNIGYETQRTNVLLNTTNLAKIPLRMYYKNLMYDVLYRVQNMAVASFTKNMDVCVVEENEIMNNSQKRNTSALVTITQKKAKSNNSVVPNDLSLQLGFQALNLIKKQKDLLIESFGIIRELMKKLIDFDETKEMQSAKPSFPYVPQLEWPSKRNDGIEGQHFNFTQLPCDVEVDENGFSLDYHISIHFELPKIKWEKDIIMNKVKEMLSIMNIKTGELIGEPIANMCYHKSTTWSGSIKLHLENSVVDARSLLQRTKAFILTLEELEEKKCVNTICLF